MSKHEHDNGVHDVIVIGGGVVGLAVLRAATLAGYKCVLLEQAADLLTQASGRNSGILCTGVDAAPGTLERALIRDSISQIRPFLKAHNIPHRPCGSLVCQWEWDKPNKPAHHQKAPLQQVLAESHDAGDTTATIISPHQLGQLEPNVSTLCVGAVHIPGEIIVDSWLFSIALAAHARENGARIITSFPFDPEHSWYDEDAQTWNLVRNEHDRPIRSKAIVNATGIMADVLQDQVAGVAAPTWITQPRRGQYRVFCADNVTSIQHPLQPIPTQHSKGIFCFTTLYNHIVVGPTALDQESRHDETPDPHVADVLTSFALRILPDLDPQTQFVGEYVGIRPATDKRDYQIYLSARRKWVVAAGIRSTGLTASLGIGRHVVHLLQSVLPAPLQKSQIRTTPLPPLSDLVKNYHANKNGVVLIQGYLYKVTHPLTKLGWDAKSGMARVKVQTAPPM